ncbi:MAG: hypothetical protein FJ293_01665 [Planctomycetes bacterium]|nr:hypothetical protein [Planctomycetota bacterium]
MLRRLLVIAGVVFLPAVAPAQGAARPEALLPPDTVLFMGTDDVDAMRAGAADSPVGRIFGEAEVTEFLAQPMTQLKQMVDMGVAMAKQQPALAGVDLDIEKLKSAPFGRGFFAITHIQFPREILQDPSKLDLGIVVGLEPRGSHDLIGMLKQVIVSLASAQGGDQLTLDTITVDGVSVERLKAKDAPFALCFANIGGVSVLSLSERSLAAMARCAKGGAPSLATSPEMGRGAAAIGSPVKGDLTVYAHVGRLMQVLRDGVAIGAAANPDDKDAQQVMSLVNAALEQFNFDAFGAALSRMTRQDGVSMTLDYTEVDADAGGIASLSKPQPIDRELLKSVPKNALSFSLGHFDVSALWDMVMGTLQKASPELHAEAMAAIRNVETLVAGADEQGNPKWDIRRDLIGALSGRTMNLTVPGMGSMLSAGGDSIFWIETPNPEGLEKSLQHLFALPGQLANYPVNFKEQTHGGAKLRVLDPTALGPAAMMAGQISPTWTIHDGKFWFSTSTKALKKALDARAAPPAENILARVDFTKHFVEPPQGAVLTSLAYSDTAANFENTYSSLLGIIPMVLGMSGAGAELPIDLSLLPSAEVISKHLFGSVSLSYAAGNGRVTVSRGPFGAETMIGGAALAAGVTAAVGTARTTSVGGMNPVGIPPPEQPVAVAKSPADAVRGDFARFSTAITVYMIEYGAPPATLDTLAQPKPEYPEGFLNGATITKDPWGNAYAYITDGKDHYTIWSFGPNGIDDKGAGDDIVQRG